MTLIISQDKPELFSMRQVQGGHIPQEIERAIRDVDLHKHRNEI